MQKYRFVFLVVFVLALGLCASLWAQKKDVPFRSAGQLTQMRPKVGHKPKQIENSPSLQKEGTSPLTLDLWISQNVPKTHRVITGTGAISGLVTQASGGDPIEGVWIQADQLFCPYDGWGTYSDEDGLYAIDSLPAGDYEVYTENESVFVDVYWDNKPDENSADTVTVVSDATTENIDFALEVGGKITGTITLTGATSVGAWATAKNIATGSYYYGDYAYNPSGSSVTYVINGLPTGSYKVWTSNDQGYLDEYYDDKPDESSADIVPVTLGLTTSGIDFTLALGGKITGTVTLPGAAFVYAGINATNTSTGDVYSGSAINYAGSDSTYAIIGLPTGTYKVRAYDVTFNYLDEYYNDELDSASADPVSVTAGGTHSGIDFTLSLGGIIKGTISSSAKGPLKSIPVTAYSTPVRSVYRYGTTNSSGIYRVTGLQSGYYKIFASGDTTYASRYYNNDSTWATADSVSVTAPDSATGKDFSLEVGGSISGYVYGEGGVPLSGASVIVYGFFDLWPVYKYTETSVDGSYKIGGLHTGKYLVLALIECDQMWYNNKPYWSPPDSVPVTMPDNTPSINFNFPSAVEDEETQTASRPAEFELTQNYPNPFNPETKIKYALKRTGHVTLNIYNILGEKVKTLLDRDQSAGFYQIDWDGKNDIGKPVSSGIYLYKLEVNGFSEAKKMLLLK
jgi:hypothetical protein